MFPTLPPSAIEIEQIHQRIAPYIHRTPVLTSASLNQLSGAELFFKCENFQKIGAFKIRGAMNAALGLPEELRQKGFATHSSGNHAQAVAFAARLLGVPAYIVMPETAPVVKKAAVEGYGARVITCKPTLQAREEAAAKVVGETGAVFIHPFDNYAVIGGQATCAKELLEDTPNLDVVMAPVGGGGLLAGTALSVGYWGKGATVVAGEPQGADDAFQSLQAGHIVPHPAPKSIADGLLTSLGERTFPIIRDGVKEIVTVSEAEIVAAMRLIWERMKIIIEPSCAVPFAALLQRKEDFMGKRVGIILTGGNVDLGKLPF